MDSQPPFSWQLRALTINSLFQLFAKAADVDGEVNEITKKKHVTLDDRPRSDTPKPTSSGHSVDLKSRYWLPPHLFTNCLTSIPLLATPLKQTLAPAIQAVVSGTIDPSLVSAQSEHAKQFRHIVGQKALHPAPLDVEVDGQQLINQWPELWQSL